MTDKTEQHISVPTAGALYIILVNTIIEGHNINDLDDVTLINNNCY